MAFWAIDVKLSQGPNAQKSTEFINLPVIDGSQGMESFLTRGVPKLQWDVDIIHAKRLQ